MEIAKSGAPSLDSTQTRDVIAWAILTAKVIHPCLDRITHRVEHSPSVCGFLRRLPPSGPVQKISRQRDDPLIGNQPGGIHLNSHKPIHPDCNIDIYPIFSKTTSENKISSHFRPLHKYPQILGV